MLVIKNQHGIRDEVHHVRQAQRIRRRRRQGGLEKPYHVVGEVAHGAATENTRPGPIRQTALRHELFQFSQRIGFGRVLAGGTPFLDGNFLAPGREDQSR